MSVLHFWLANSLIQVVGDCRLRLLQCYCCVYLISVATVVLYLITVAIVVLYLITVAIVVLYLITVAIVVLYLITVAIVVLYLITVAIVVLYLITVAIVVLYFITVSQLATSCDVDNYNLSTDAKVGDERQWKESQRTSQLWSCLSTDYNLNGLSNVSRCLFV